MLMLFSLCVTGFLDLSSTETAEKENAMQKLETAISNINDFSPGNIQQAANCIIALDEDRSKSAIADITGTYVYDFNKIVESEILQDEVSINKVSRTGQIGGALLGGVLAE